MFLFPTYSFHRVTDITPAFLNRLGIRGLILDVDNPLTTHNNPKPLPGVPQWLQTMKEQGIGLMILSNNHPHRVEPFAKMLDLPFVADGKKPLASGMKRAAKALGIGREQVAIVGDQLFTDVWAGNHYGCVSILVEPIEPEDFGFLAVKRRWERPLLKAYHRRKDRN